MPTRHPRSSILALAVLALMSLAGCQLVGGMVENYRKDSTKLVNAESTSLAGKSFAVLVAADRAIQAEHPGLVDYLSDQIAMRLADPANQPGAAGFVKPSQVLAYQYNTPGWAAKSYADLAADLGGVQRIILVEVIEYRLHEQGNPYEWAGVASANISVIESDGPSPNDAAFSKSVTVPFPDQKGYGPSQLARQVVTTALASRLVDRSAWVFIDHQEPYYPKY